jgi:hypothetical protein
MFFLMKGLLIKPLKSQNIFTQPQISIKKINTHYPWPKPLQKNAIQLSHMSFTTSVTRV